MSTTDLESESPTAQPASMRTSGRRVGDSIFSYLSIGSGVLIFLTLAAVAVFLTTESMPAIIASQEFSGTAEFRHAQPAPKYVAEQRRRRQR